MSQQKLSWVGLIVEDSMIEANLGEGSFSFIYGGRSLSSGSATAFKLAKARDLVERVSNSIPTVTNALSFFTGGTRDIRPDAEELLALQFAKIEAASDTALVKVKKLSQQNGLCYYEMEHLAGVSFRQLVSEGKATLAHFASLALMLDRLSSNKYFAYHGDLKPENIIVGPGSMKLIDPGYFGPLKCQEGMMSKVAITTTSYYPSLTPDDLYAFGIMLWEACLGEHPLLSHGAEALNGTACGDKLKQRVKRHSAIGYYGFEPLLNLRPPSAIHPGLAKPVEEFLLQALRLKIDEHGRLEDADEEKNFADFAAIHSRITALQAMDLDLLAKPKG